MPGYEGLYAAVGFSGHGFKMSPIVGQLVSELVVDGKASSLDIAALRATRFAENDPVKAAYTYGVMG
jgi:glycine/D-amino acid oxidase-like deaminating enzyme